MTQMLLFDAPSEISGSGVAVATVSSETATASESSGVDAPAADHQAGLHHMGDLARLVLLRYDLVAKRRARRQRASR